jgi:hypothetical protein
MTSHSLTLPPWPRIAGAELLARANTSIVERTSMGERAGFGCWCTAAEVRTCTEGERWLLSLHLLTCFAASMNIASVVTSSCRRARARTSLMVYLLRMPAQHAMRSRAVALVHLMCWLSAAMFQLCQHTPSRVHASASTKDTSPGHQCKCASRALLTCAIHCDLSVQSDLVGVRGSIWTSTSRTAAASAMTPAGHSALPVIEHVLVRVHPQGEC